MVERRFCAVAGDADADAGDPDADAGDRALDAVRMRAAVGFASCVRRGVTGADTVPLGGVEGGMMKRSCEEAAEVGERGSSSVQTKKLSGSKEKKGEERRGK